MFTTPDKERDFFFPLVIVDAAAKQGINVVELINMVRHSTRFTHPLGNRRFKDFLFMVEGDRVIGFGKVTDQPDPKIIMPPVRKRCPDCDKGLVQSTIVCPECDGAPDRNDSRYVGCASCGGNGRVVVFDQCGRCEGSGLIVV